jgi:hypothetical protein
MTDFRVMGPAAIAAMNLLFLLAEDRRRDPAWRRYFGLQVALWSGVTYIVAAIAETA